RHAPPPRDPALRREQRSNTEQGTSPQAHNGTRAGLAHLKPEVCPNNSSGPAWPPAETKSSCRFSSFSSERKRISFWETIVWFLQDCKGRVGAKARSMGGTDLERSPAGTSPGSRWLGRSPRGRSH